MLPNLQYTMALSATIILLNCSLVDNNINCDFWGNLELLAQICISTLVNWFKNSFETLNIIPI